MRLKEEEFKKGKIAIWKEDIRGKKNPKRRWFEDSEEEEMEENQNTDKDIVIEYG